MTLPVPHYEPESERNHRVVLKFDDGVYVEKLIHPKGGCVGSDQCGHCAADLTDPDSTRCYDCKSEGPHECWVQGWFDNATAEELLHGRIEVEIDCRWEFDHMEAHIVSASKSPAPVHREEGKADG